MNIQTELKACRKAWQENPDAKYAWCCHHNVLSEPLIEPYGLRIDYILSYKPVHEQTIRLHNFRPVRVKIPQSFDEAWKACDEAGKAFYEAWKAFDEARKAFDEAWKACDEAGKDYGEARKACGPELVGLFKQDWPDNTWNGKDIFNDKTTTQSS